MIANKNKRLAQSFAVLTGGVALTQLIVIASSPILTRLYTPENFGVLATYTSLLGILSVISSLRYELALPSSNGVKEEINLFSLSVLITLFNFIIISIITYFYLDTLLMRFKLEELISFKWLLPFGFVFSGIYNVSIQLAVKQRRYKDVSKTKISQSLSMIGIQIIFFKLGSIALLLGHVIGQSLGTMRIILKNNILNKVKIHTNKKNIIEVFVKYKSFPKFSLPSSLMNAIGSQLPVIMLSALFSPAIAGFYALAQRVIFLPVTLLTNSIVSIIFGEGGEYKKNNQLNDKIWDLHKNLTFLSLPLLIPVALVLPMIFKFIFGDQWIVSGQFAALLTPWFFLVFTMVPIFDTFEAFYNQKLIMVFQFFLSISRILGIYIGYLQNDVYKSLLYFSLISFTIFMVFFFMILKNLKIHFKKVLRFYLTLLGIVIIVLSPFVLKLITNIDSNYIIWTTFIPAVAITGYYIVNNLKSLRKNRI